MHQVLTEQLLCADTVLDTRDTSGGLEPEVGGKLVKDLGQRWQDQGTVMERCLWVRLEPEAGEVRTHSP